MLFDSTASLLPILRVTLFWVLIRVIVWLTEQFLFPPGFTMNLKDKVIYCQQHYSVTDEDMSDMCLK